MKWTCPSRSNRNNPLPIARPGQCGLITTLQRLLRTLSETKPLLVIFIKKKKKKPTIKIKNIQEAEATSDKVIEQYSTATRILLSVSGVNLPE